jgi:benzoylformate decarboxylase
MAISGAQAFLQILANSGVRYLFGNPGTTELPLSDALVGYDRIKYILGLQEVPVMAMADGYAMASRSLSVVNLHISCGLGNAMGMLYNAWREGTPLLVTAGQQDRRLKFEEPILWGDMVSVARPWTKWSVEVERLADLPSAVRRAAQLALTPPTGPVFLSLPMDLQMELGELDTSGVQIADSRVRPPLDALRKAADVLAAARNPAILVGSRVVERDAMDELVALAESLGAPVYSEPNHTHGRLSFPADHPLYAQVLPHWSPEIRETLKEFDVLLVAGMDLMRQYVYHEPARAIPEHIRIVHLDEDVYQIGKNYPVEVGVLGDTKAGLSELSALIGQRLNDAARSAIQQRRQKRQDAHLRKREEFVARIEQERSQRPMTPKTLMSTIARRLPENVAVIEEAVTTTNTALERLGVLGKAAACFGHRGWALGWGLGCAIGVKLAWPDRPVLAILGEGAAMYGIQGLWSAAHHKLGVTFVIANNAQYQILKAGARGLGLPAANREQFVGMDLRQPEIDMVGLARSLGVDAQRVSEPEELDELLKTSLNTSSPRLIDVTIQRSLAGPG